jgi:hypothetical protein
MDAVHHPPILGCLPGIVSHGKCGASLGNEPV